MFFGPAPASEAEARIDAWEATLQRSPTVEAALLRTRARLAWIQGRFDESLAWLEAWAGIERELGRKARLSALEGHYVGPLEMARGRYPEAARAFRTGFDAQRALGDVGYSSTVAGGLAHAVIELGEYEEAERYGRIALEGSAEDDVEPKIAGGGALAVALAQQGRLDEAEPLARRTVELARRTDYTMTQAAALIDLARVLAARGAHEEADAAAAEAIDLLERKEAWALAARAREAAEALRPS